MIRILGSWQETGVPERAQLIADNKLQRAGTARAVLMKTPEPWWQAGEFKVDLKAGTVLHLGRLSFGKGGPAMLILSRRADQELVFPNLGIRLHILKVRGQLVKLGIDAPADVKVLRSELLTEEETCRAMESRSAEERHELRNRLNALQLELQLLQKEVALGTAFEAQASLQRIIANCAVLDHDAGPAHGSATGRDAGRAFRLLVVEDSDNERCLLAHLLAVHGFDVTVARDGIEAMEQLQQGVLPDLVLLDINMPLSGGEETLERIRSNERFSDLPVFAVTGNPRPSAELEAEGRGWNGWFVKPLNVNSLIESMRQRLPELASQGA